MDKIAYIIPGYDESYLKQKGYNQIAKFFISRGIKPVHININWDIKKPADFEIYNKQFLSKYRKTKNQQIYILGFSYGAFISFLTASKTKPFTLILCSLSPYFTEDYKNLKPAWLKWWKKNFKNEYTFKDLAKNISAKTYLIAGDKEPISVLIRAKRAKRLIKNSSLIIAKSAKHKISQKEYLLTVGRLINKL